MKQQALFITFEGPEGSGKSTIIKMISEWLESENMKFIVTREPGGSKIAEQIRSVILDKSNTEMDGMTEALLYAASRRQHIVDTINPNLENNVIVLCDRYLDSSLVYQGSGRGLTEEKVNDINFYATNGLLPIRTFFFDVSPEVGMSRISKADRDTNRLDKEKIEFHQTVHKAYIELSKKYRDRYITVDAAKEIDVVFNDVKKHLEELLND